MKIPDNIAEIVDRINKDAPVHSMWDGFYIFSFKKQTLVISGSFDHVFHRSFDFAFKKVSFFNVPAEWRDTDIPGNELIRLSNKEEFALHHPDFDPLDNIIVALDMYFHLGRTPGKHTFFIVCRRIYLQECMAPTSDAEADYEEPFKDEFFPCKKNRVGAEK